MSTPFGGVRGRAVYKIELDDSGVRTKLQGFTSELQRSNFAIANLNKPMGSLNNNFETMSGRLTSSVSPLSNVRKELGTLPSTFDKTGAAAEKTGGKLKGLGEAFRGNKGLVFGFAGLASAAAEGIGMIGMYGDAADRTREAQEKFNEAVAKYGENSKQAIDANAELSKQTRFLGMMTRNLVLSQMDQVFFATMVISSLSQMNLKGGVLGKMIGGLKGGFEALKTSMIATNVASATGIIRLDALGASSLVTAGGMTTATAATNGLAASIGRLMLAAGPLVIALAGAIRIYEDFGKLSETMSQVVKGNTIEAIKSLRTQVEALTLVKFDDPLSWFNALNPGSGVLKLSGVKEQLDQMITGLENGTVTLKDSGQKVADTWTDLTPKGEKLASSINNVSNEMLGILPYTERMNALFKQTSAEAEMFSNEFETGVLASTLAIKEMAMGFDFLKNTTEPVNEQMDTLLGTLEKSGPVWDQQIEAAKTSSLILGEVGDVIDELPQKEEKWNKAIDETNDLLDKLSDARNKLQDPSDILGKDPFDVKFDVDKKFEKFINSLGGDLETNIKLTFKGMGTDKKIVDWITKTAKVVLNMPVELQPDEKGADRFADKTIDMIKNAYKRKGQDLKPSPEVQKVIDKITEIKKAPDSWTKLTEYFNSPEFLATLSLIDPLDAQKIADILAPEQDVKIPVNATFDLSNLKNIKSSKGSGGNASEIENIFEGGDNGLTIPATVTADTSGVAKAIEDLSNKNPSILLKTNKAYNQVDSVRKRIDSLESINPFVLLKTNKAYNQIESIRKRIMSIEDLHPSVTVHVGLSGPGASHMAKGGVISFAKGGVISASNGYTEESAGPQLVLMGDNPGGHETHAFIPHNNPNPIMDTLNSKFGGSNGSGDIHIHNHFFDREVLQSYQRNNGRLMSRFGSRGSL